MMAAPCGRPFSRIIDVVSPNPELIRILKPLPGVVVALIEDPKEGPILISEKVEQRRRLWERTRQSEKVMRQRFGAIAMHSGIVVASGKAREGGQPPPLAGAEILVMPDRYNMRIHPCDSDDQFDFLSRHIPKGWTLCFYGLRCEWDEWILAEKQETK